MWNEVPLDQLGYVSRGRSRHRPRNDSILYGGDYPFIQTAEVKSAVLRITEHSQTYNENGLAQSRLWPENTLCITIAANIADTALLSYPACFPDSIIGFIADENKCDVRFIKYFFDVVQERMQMVSHGATQDNLSQDKLLRFGIPCPPLEVQNKIGDILTAYNDLIETNRRRIALLEESTRLLYREWFVNLRFPGHDLVKWIDGLPDGWRVMPLSEVAKVNSATLNTTAAPESIQYIDIASVETGCIRETTEMSFASAPGRARRLVQHGDVIWSCVRPNRKSYALIWEPDENIVVSTGFAVISASQVPFSYLYLTITSDEFVAFLTNRATGAAYPAVTAKDFEAAEIMLPDKGVLKDFHERCESILEMKENLLQQNKRLMSARDELLPKLMSGAIQV